MYTKIEILETDFEDKYLVKHKENSMYVGYITKDIIELLNDNKENNEICTRLSIKYHTDISLDTIHDVKVKVDNFLLKNEEVKSFYKIAKIFNPNRVTIPRKFYAIFNSMPFYLTLFILAIINVVFFGYSKVNTLTLNENVILYIILFCILIGHEIGHSISAKKFDINVAEIGLGIYYIIPVLYVNLNEIWKLDRKKRIIINFSGIYFQFFIGLFIIIFSFIINDFKNVLINLFNFNLMIIILNFNPFFKFDGYWIVSDLLNEKNLEKTSNQVIKNLLKFRKADCNYTIIIYSILRFLFIIWILINLFKYFLNSFYQLFSSKSFNWENYFPMLILFFFLYKIIKPFFKTKTIKYELKSTKRDL